jgi:hypothetical protein
MIDWSAGQDQVTEHFTVKDMLWLPSWNRLAIESDFTDDPWEQVLTNLVTLASKLEAVREWAQCPLRVHVTARPPAYNLAIHGALHSAHREGLACDFDPEKYQGLVSVNEACAAFIRDITYESQGANGSMLAGFGMRCEDNGPLPGWVHLDLYGPNPNRYFKP